MGGKMPRGDEIKASAQQVAKHGPGTPPHTRNGSHSIRDDTALRVMRTLLRVPCRGKLWCSRPRVHSCRNTTCSRIHRNDQHQAMIAQLTWHAGSPELISKRLPDKTGKAEEGGEVLTSVSGRREVERRGRKRWCGGVVPAATGDGPCDVRGLPRKTEVERERVGRQGKSWLAKL